MMTKLAAAMFVVATGCASEPTDGDLHVSGRIADARVTHVVAVNTASGARTIVEVQHGAFDIALAQGEQVLLTAADATKKGRDMFIGTIDASSARHTFNPTHGGELDLGTVKPGLVVGKTDDLALRVSNPDIDGDGQISNNAPMLEVNGTYTLTRDGRPLTVSDLTVGDKTNVRVRYESTLVSAVVPASKQMAMSTGTMMFEEPFYGTAFGPETPMIAPFTQIGAPHVKLGSLAGDSLIGVVARGGFNVPSGTYEIDFANGALTYTNVFPPSQAALESAQSYSVPFLHIQPAVKGCIANCEIDALELQWPATAKPAHVVMVLHRNGKETALSADMTDKAIAWHDISVAKTGLSDRELAYFTTQNICYVAVSYESELGMRMTNQLSNPDCF